MLLDARGVAHSTSSMTALGRYETAVEQFQSYRGDAAKHLRRAPSDHRHCAQTRAPAVAEAP
jgi:hypothetical protein